MIEHLALRMAVLRSCAATFLSKKAKEGYPDKVVEGAPIGDGDGANLGRWSASKRAFGERAAAPAQTS
jgi:hypothetical protein